MKRLIREFAEEDSKYAHLVRNENVIYSRLLNALPREYVIIVDVQRIKKNTVQNMLVELQKKESSLGKKKHSAYLSHDKFNKSKSKTRFYRNHHSSSLSESSLFSPSRKRKSFTSKSRIIHQCHLCGGNHFVKNCPDLEEAVKHIFKSRSRFVFKSRDSKERGRFHKSSSSKSTYTSKRIDSREGSEKIIIKEKNNFKYSKAYQTESDSEERQNSSESENEEKEKSAKERFTKHIQNHKESSDEKDESVDIVIENISGSSSLKSMFLKLLNHMHTLSFSILSMFRK